MKLITLDRMISQPLISESRLCSTNQQTRKTTSNSRYSKDKRHVLDPLGVMTIATTTTRSRTTLQQPSTQIHRNRSKPSLRLLDDSPSPQAAVDAGEFNASQWSKSLGSTANGRDVARWIFVERDESVMTCLLLQVVDVPFVYVCLIPS